MIKNLDPGNKVATERLNRYFCEDHKNIGDFNKRELLWYLRQTLLWLELRDKKK